ncbi:MAG: hypothetical protein GC205_06495 [Bacteroidetes bacterium]|nr:hypothetical protein [Bacteroidota bacterium]
MKKTPFLFALATLTFAISSCNKEGDDDHNHVDIAFLEPSNGQSFTGADAANVHIHVRFTADEENEAIVLRLYPEGDPTNLILNIDLHEHDQVIDIEEDVDLSAYPAGTEFHLEAEACEDHDCIEVVTDDIHFTRD